MAACSNPYEAKMGREGACTQNLATEVRSMICRIPIVHSSLQTVERLEGLRPEVEDAVAANLGNCLLESKLDLGQCTVVTFITSHRGSIYIIEIYHL